MRDKPDACYEAGCPLAKTGRGFVLDVGDPERAVLALVGEAPGRDELSHPTDEAEQARRRQAYPAFDRWWAKGVPFVGKAGRLLQKWLDWLGIKREEVFIANVLRCLPSKYGDANYPTGEDRIKAEKCCRMYDRWSQFRPEVVVVGMHPAGIIRDTTALPLALEALRKARNFSRSKRSGAPTGGRTILLLGEKAAKLWLPYVSGVTRWCGHYAKVRREDE